MPEGHGSIIPYGEAAHPLLEKYQGELLVAGETEQVIDLLEGNWLMEKDARFTLFKFPSMEYLKQFWNSDEYQAIKHLRINIIPLPILHLPYLPLTCRSGSPYKV